MPKNKLHWMGIQPSSLHLLLSVCRVCVCVPLSRPSSLNIVLCSSSRSSSGSAVAAQCTVYFPSWRTTSYQISRHCLQTHRPTTRSLRKPCPLSFQAVYRQDYGALMLWCSLSILVNRYSRPTLTLTVTLKNKSTHDKSDTHTHTYTVSVKRQMWQMTQCVSSVARQFGQRDNGRRRLPQWRFYESEPVSCYTSGSTGLQWGVHWRRRLTRLQQLFYWGL